MKTPSGDWPLRLHERVEDAALGFIATCTRAGFTSTPSEPILTRDPTLLFANSTIVRFKEALRQGIREPGFCLVQPCVRVQNLRLVRSNSADLDYMSCFNQAGTIAPHVRLNQILSCIDSLLGDLPLTMGRVVVKTNAEMLDVVAVRRWLDQHPQWQVEIDAAPPAYYRWSYGIAGTDGIGLTFALRETSGAAADFGNLVGIRTGGSITAWEFGYGLETLDARMHSCRTPFESSVVYGVLREEMGGAPDLALCDSIQLSALLHCLGVSEGSGKRESVIRRALIDAVLLALRNGIDLGAMNRTARGICRQATTQLEFTYETVWKRIERKLALVNEYVAYARRHGMPNAKVIEYAQMTCGLPAAFMDVVFASVDVDE